MKITYIRHSPVLFNWNKFYNNKTFQLACQEYDLSPIVAGDKLDIEGGGTVYVSSLSRTAATAKNLLPDGVDWIKTDLLNEVPLAAFTNLTMKLPTSLWMIFGRCQWYFNISRQPETRNDSKRRINTFLDLILAQGVDCVIIGHGFFFAQMVNELKSRGIVGDMHKRLKNEEVRVFYTT